ncbi:HEPN domain-containing protein [Sphingobacterium paramultivorum]|uniref:HEPN domain-containing protein n=1 Tax=Sphingobacterium paramultivorum TaxID=2886510 RepID=UPI00129CAEF8|nr:HEPN domain-containing protein [Sphingobacterium paramultivorum]
MNTDINPIIEAILRAVAVDEIYQWTFDHDGKKYQMLQVNLTSNAGIRFSDANSLINKTVGSYPNVYINVNFTHEIQQKLNQGLGRAYLICQPENRIYQNPMQDIPLVLQNNKSDEVIEKTRTYINKEKGKIRSFIDGYNFYFEHKNYAHAAFMLHQALELAFRTAENILVVEDKKSHSLKNHINYLKAFDDRLGTLTDNMENKQALEKINKAYIDYRYHFDYFIDEDVLETAYQIAINTLNWIYDYSNLLFEEIKSKLNPVPAANNEVENCKNNNEIYKQSYCNANYRDLILNAIERYCTPALIVCFGYDSDHHKYQNALQKAKNDCITHTYYIFVAYDTLNAELNNLPQLITDLLPNNVSLTLALENSAAFSKQLLKGHPFFLSLLKAGDIWFQNPSIANIDLESIVAPQLNLDYVHQQWKTRYNNAHTLYLPYEEDRSSISIEATYYMLSQALEQACLGVINSVIQYKPQRVNLTFLMTLCKLIVPDAYATFCLDHEDHLYAFKNITEAQQEFRYNVNYKANPLTFPRLQELTKTFIEKCNNEMEIYFEKISSQQLLEQVE